MPLKDWRTFIGKKSNYYVELFKKKEDKPFFISMNAGAFFFSYSWYIYRKMYKAAALLYVLSLVLTIAFTVIGVATAFPDTVKAAKEFKPWMVYITSDGEPTTEYPQNDEALQQEIRAAYRKFENVIKKVSLRGSLCGVIGGGLSFFVNAFFANYFYREYILNNTVRRKGYVANNGKGGVAFGPAVLFFLFGETVLNYIGVFISMILLFIISGI